MPARNRSTGLTHKKSNGLGWTKPCKERLRSFDLLSTLKYFSLNHLRMMAAFIRLSFSMATNISAAANLPADCVVTTFRCILVVSKFGERIIMYIHLGGCQVCMKIRDHGLKGLGRTL